MYIKKGYLIKTFVLETFMAYLGLKFSRITVLDGSLLIHVSFIYEYENNSYAGFTLSICFK